MIINTSFPDPKIKRQIEELAGKPIGFFKSLKLGGTGSQRLIVLNCSDTLDRLFQLDNYQNHCNIEIRPIGIIVHFRSRLETYAWVISNEELIISDKDDTWVIQAGTDYMNLSGANNRTLDQSFFERLKHAVNHDRSNTAS